MKRGIRTSLLLNQVLVLVLIISVLGALTTVSLNRIHIQNLDKILHLQADTYSAIIIKGNKNLGVKDYFQGFQHSLPLEEEIPFQVQILDTRYHTLLLSGQREGYELFQGEALPLIEDYQTKIHGEDRLRQLCMPLSEDGHHLGWIMVAISQHYMDDSRKALFATALFSTLAAILLLIAATFRFVRISLKPMTQMAAKVAERSRSDRFEPLPLPAGDDEFTFLTQTFNDLLNKIKLSFQALERFSADASHELKTPITIMRGDLLKAEKAHQKGAAIDFKPLNAEINRMQNLIDNLLILSRTNQHYPLRLKDIWLNDFITDETARWQYVLQDHVREFDLSRIDSIKINTDSYLLMLVFTNLLRNAAHYSPPESSVMIYTKVAGVNLVEIGIIDEGPGIPEAKIQQMFERFVRLDSSRHREDGGTGLGLSIAQWAVQHLGGRIELSNQHPKGLLASIFLPSKLDNTQSGRMLEHT